MINWSKDSNNPVFTGGRFCPFAIKRGDYFYFIVPHFTSGRNYAEFELYRDTRPTFYPKDRELLKVVKTSRGKGWDSHDMDTPCILTDNIYRDSYSCANNELWMYYDGENKGLRHVGMTIERDIDKALSP